MATLKTQPTDSNPDPITGTPGAHPVGTGVGAAAGGAVAGAAVGTVAGPVGAFVGAAVGAVVGGLAGKGIAEGVNPSVDEVYWREQFAREPYYLSDYTYDDYAPAYRLGTIARDDYPGRAYDDIEAELARKWDATRGASRLAWMDAKYATRAAWHRVERRLPGDADGDGR